MTSAALRRLLEAEGLTVKVAGTYRQAVALASEWFPDLLVCDIDLPGKDGIQVMQCMRQAHPNLRGIVVSGHTSEQARQRSRDAGFSLYLHKPIRCEQLVDAIHKLAAE